MKKYDILITYEIKNREIENICLIKRELERRGYSVGVCMQYETFFKVPEPIEAEVIVIPAYYRERAKFYTASHLIKTKKIVNLRWEQVSINDAHEDRSRNVLWSIKEWGNRAVHIAWGNNAVDQMTNTWGVPKENVKKTGHIALDFMRHPLRKYYVNKKELCSRFNIPAEKRLNLFISSLSLVMMHEHVIKNSTFENKYDLLNKQIREAKETQKKILEWFERILEENKDDVIVYRPHPEERSSKLLKELATRQPRFFVIGEESVKQWILASDKIYTWISTSVAEVYAAGKGCSILRPVKIDHKNDMIIYNDSIFIENYEDFSKNFKEESQTFGVSENQINDNYYIDEKRFSFELVSDVIEEVFKNDKYLLPQPLENPFFGKIISKERIKNFIKRSVTESKILNFIHRKNLFPGSKLRYLLDDVIYVKEKLNRNFVSQKEIEEIISRIDSVFAQDKK